MKKFKVCVVTGTRAEFGIWRPVLAAMRRSKVLVPQLLVTGMHLLKAFGGTVKEVEASEVAIAGRAEMYRGGEGSHVSLARGIKNMGEAMVRLRPNMVLLLGDRLEMLAAASAAVALRIPIGHLHGGESAQGIWDEQIRHAITKMAHVHFCATQQAAKRIRHMGEDPRRIHLVGAPALDTINAFIASHPGFSVPHNPAAPMIALLHPSSGDDDLEQRRAEMLLAAIGGHPFALIGPNNDPGHKGILRAYDRRGLGTSLVMSLAQNDFWQILTQGSLLIGNSSAGIIEAASFGLPVVNIGERQAGRERNPNVIDTDWNPRKIAAAINKSLHDPAFRKRTARRKNLYGDGKAATRIIATLEKIARSGIGLEKKFCD